MTQIHLQTNEEKLYANLGSVFSDKSKVLAELLQNARRAGATHITVTMEGDSLTIEDDGHGIKDFQKLLTNSESGWDDAVSAAENPFGMGWLSTLYAAERVIITSCGQHCAIDTKAARQRSSFVVEPVVDNGRTVITLEGFQLPILNTMTKLEMLVKVFPVPVSFNGKDLSRPHALDHLSVSALECGHGHILGIHTAGQSTMCVRLYFQGLPIDPPPLMYASYDHNHNVIHLDSSFAVRMPDRDSLIDPQIQSQRIAAAIEKFWQAHLTTLKSTLPASAFVGYFADLAKFDRLALLNDVEVLPPETLAVVPYYPIKQDHGYYGASEGLTKQSIESGNTVILSNVDFVPSEFEYAVAFAAYRENWQILTHALDAGHWIYDHAIDVTGVDIKVVREPVQTKHFCLRVGYGTVELVKQFTVQIGALSCTYHDEAIALDTSDGGDEGVVIIAGAPGQVIEQLCNYLCDDHYQEDWCDDDNAQLQSFVDVMRGQTATDSMQRLLLKGRIFDKENCRDIALVTAVCNGVVKCVTLEEVLTEFCQQTDSRVTQENITQFVQHVKPENTPVVLHQEAPALID